MINPTVKEFMDLRESNTGFDPNDKRDRRSGIDRRRFSYTAHIPERRKAKDRRRSHRGRDTDSRRGLDSLHPFLASRTMAAESRKRYLV